MFKKIEFKVEITVRPQDSAIYAQANKLCKNVSVTFVHIIYYTFFLQSKGFRFLQVCGR